LTGELNASLVLSLDSGHNLSKPHPPLLRVFAVPQTRAGDAENPLKKFLLPAGEMPLLFTERGHTAPNVVIDPWQRMCSGTLCPTLRDGLRQR
jgi:hypothetical protein